MFKNKKSGSMRARQTTIHVLQKGGLTRGGLSQTIIYTTVTVTVTVTATVIAAAAAAAAAAADDAAAAATKKMIQILMCPIIVNVNHRIQKIVVLL